METTFQLVLLAFIALLSGVVGVLLWRIFHNQRELRDKNDVIIREVCENDELRAELRDAFQRLGKVAMVVALLLTLGACDKDGDKQSAVTGSLPEAEVCIVFAPGELGDQGYADRLLTGLFQFEKQMAGHGRYLVRTRYVSVNDVHAVQSELQNWARQNVSPFTHKVYERRLLVLSDPLLLDMFDNAPVAVNDEVLLTNVSNQLFGQAPWMAGMGQRLHLLSISAAEAARKFCRMVDKSETVSPSTQKQLWLLKEMEDVNASADSIGVELLSHLENNGEYQFVSLSKKEYGHNNNISLSDAYTYAHLFPFGVSVEDYSCYLICGWGGLNVALSSMIAAKDLGSTQATFLDTDYIALNGVCHTIIRHYDRALLQWLQRWIETPAASMPEREWHGAWDGYVTDDLP